MERQKLRKTQFFDKEFFMSKIGSDRGRRTTLVRSILEQYKKEKN